MRIGPHAPFANGRQGGDFLFQPTIRIEQFVGPVGSHPFAQQLYMFRLVHVAERHLMRAPRTFAFLAINRFRAGPSLGRTQDDHRPARPGHVAAFAGLTLDGENFGNRRVDRSSHQLMHGFRVVALNKDRLVAVTDEQAFQFAVTDAGQDGRVGDLVTVEVEDGQHGTIVTRIEEFVGMPGSGERPGFRLTIADNATGDQVRVVENGPVCMKQRVAELTAFMDGSRRIRRNVAGNAARKRELLEQPAHALAVLRNILVILAVAAFQPGIGHHARAPMTGAGDEDHVEVVQPDHPVHMDVNEVQTWRRPPVTEQARLDVRQAERHLEQRIVEQVNLADRQVIGSAPPGVHALEFVTGEGHIRVSHVISLCQSHCYGQP